MAFLLGSLVSLIVAAGLLYFRRGIVKKLRVMIGTEPYSVRDLEKLWQGVASEIGPRLFFRQVEVSGVAECDSPLLSEVSRTDCVCYHTRVEREYEEEKWEADGKGERHRVIQRMTETMSDITQHVRFWIRDETGHVLIDPKDAELTMEVFVDKFEPAPATTSGSMTFQAGPLTVSTDTGGGRTLGYRTHEEGMRVGAVCFVLGEASDREGVLVISRSQEKGIPFVISTKTEEQLRGELSRTASFMAYGAIALGVLAVGLLIAGLVSLM